MPVPQLCFPPQKTRAVNWGDPVNDSRTIIQLVTGTLHPTGASAVVTETCPIAAVKTLASAFKKAADRIPVLEAQFGRQLVLTAQADALHLSRDMDLRLAQQEIAALKWTNNEMSQRLADAETCVEVKDRDIRGLEKEKQELEIALESTRAALDDALTALAASDDDNEDKDDDSQDGRGPEDNTDNNAQGSGDSNGGDEGSAEDDNENDGSMGSDHEEGEVDEEGDEDDESEKDGEEEKEVEVESEDEDDDEDDDEQDDGDDDGDDDDDDDDELEEDELEEGELQEDNDTDMEPGTYASATIPAQQETPGPGAFNNSSRISGPTEQHVNTHAHPNLPQPIFRTNPFFTQPTQSNVSAGPSLAQLHHNLGSFNPFAGRANPFIRPPPNVQQQADTQQQDVGMEVDGADYQTLYQPSPITGPSNPLASSLYQPSAFASRPFESSTASQQNHYQQPSAFAPAQSQPMQQQDLTGLPSAFHSVYQQPAPSQNLSGLPAGFLPVQQQHQPALSQKLAGLPAGFLPVQQQPAPTQDLSGLPTGFLPVQQQQQQHRQQDLTGLPSAFLPTQDLSAIHSAKDLDNAIDTLLLSLS